MGMWGKRLFAFAVLVVSLGAASIAQPFRFVTTSDAQGPSEADPDPGAAFGYVIGQINALTPRPDFWIFGGDPYYSATDSADAMVHWQTWKNIADPLSDIQLYPAIGNHDANVYGHFYGPWHGDGAGPFKASWPGLPQNGPAGYRGTAYSFRWGNGIFCVVNTNMYNVASYGASFKVDATQRAWLTAVLDTTTAVHKFVIGHVEAYPPSNSGSSSLEWNAADRDTFWQVLAANGVEAYICGHVHLWNGDYFAAAGYGNAPASTTTRQVICGGAGGTLVAGYGGNYYHFVVWDIDGGAVTARVIDSYGNLRDSITYVTGVEGRPREAPAGPPAGRIYYVSGRIRWGGPETRASIAVYDIGGRRMWSAPVAGNDAMWGGIDQGTGNKAPSGVYLVRIIPDGGSGRVRTGKIIVLH
jgi:Icc protein